MSKHVKDHEKDQFVDLGNRESAVRVAVSDLNAAVPQNWGGISIQNTADGQPEVVQFYSDAAKSDLIRTITVTYTDGVATGIISV